MVKTLNEVKWKFLSEQLGVSGSLSNLEYRWLVRETMRTGHTTPQLWFSYLRGRGYSGSVPQMLMKFLGDLGYEGSLTERLYDWYKDYSLASALSLLGNEPNGAVFDFQNNACVIKDQTTPANNFYGTIDEAIAATIISFSRASPASRFNASGLLETVSSGVWRNQYDPVTLQPLGYLPEPQRTNLATYSDDYSNAAWSKANTTITVDTAVAPDGTTTADKVVEDNTTTTHYVANSTISVTSGTTYTVSVFLKAAERGHALMALSGPFPTTAIQVNLSTGVVATGVGTPLNPFAVNCGNGWWRVGFSLAANATGSSQWNTYVSADGTWANRSYLGNGASGILAWGAQFEAGAYPTTRIPTAGSTVTRLADVMTSPLSKLPFSATAWTVVASAQPSPDAVNGDHRLFYVDDGTVNNRGWMMNGGPGSKALQAQIISGAVNQANFVTSTGAITGRFKAALAAAANDFEFVMNGASIGTDADGAMPVSPTKFNIGINQNAGQHWSAPIESLVLIPRRLSQAEMIARTAA